MGGWVVSVDFGEIRGLYHKKIMASAGTLLSGIMRSIHVLSLVSEDNTMYFIEKTGYFFMVRTGV